jgi:D-3-phosphoglycerate dehydrogenase
MGFKVVHTLAVPGKNLGEGVLQDLDVGLVKGLWQTEDELIAECADADAVIGDIARKPFTRRVMEQWRHCRVLAGVNLGYDAMDLAAATDGTIVVTNVPDYCLDEVSGRAIALMMALGYKIVRANDAVKTEQRSMVPNMNMMLEVISPVRRMRGQTLGLIGCSKIGIATALKAKGLGLRVIAYDPFVFGGVLESLGIEPTDMDTLLKESDFVSLHVPATPDTKNLMGYERFSQMKTTAYIINTSRGSVIDELGLIKALQEGLIAGAGLDVTAIEPIEKENPLINMPNVILTGHSGWYSQEAEAELFYKPMLQVAMALEGKWPSFAINPLVKERWLKKWATEN